jgi:hypothetical protein
VALRRTKRTSSSVKSGPTPCSKHALTQAKLGPYAASSGLHLRSNRDRRHIPGVHLLRPNRGLTPHQEDFTFGQIGTDTTLQACSYSGQIGALRRIKWTSSLVTTISDRLGSGALNVVRARAVTYPAEAHLEDYAPPQGGSIASTTLRKHAQEEKIWAQRVGGTLTYITHQKQDIRGRLVKNLTLPGSGGEPRSLPREEKSTSPTT